LKIRKENITKNGLDKTPDEKPIFTTSQEANIWEMIWDGFELEEILLNIRQW
jgi:hypothetical protein